MPARDGPSTMHDLIEGLMTLLSLEKQGRLAPNLSSAGKEEPAYTRGLVVDALRRTGPIIHRKWAFGLKDGRLHWRRAEERHYVQFENSKDIKVPADILRALRDQRGEEESPFA